MFWLSSQSLSMFSRPAMLLPSPNYSILLLSVSSCLVLKEYNLRSSLSNRNIWSLNFSFSLFSTTSRSDMLTSTSLKVTIYDSSLIVSEFYYFFFNASFESLFSVVTYDYLEYSIQYMLLSLHLFISMVFLKSLVEIYSLNRLLMYQIA